jgi:hypothetical protein
MADTIYTRALGRAAEIQGSTQALASLLRVPENTLLRWMSGRAQMPLQAFLKLIELLSQNDRAGVDTRVQDLAEGEKLTFTMGQLTAHCARCDGTEFATVAPSAALKFTSHLACCSCGETIVHGNLIAALAKDAVYHSRAMTAARVRRRTKPEVPVKPLAPKVSRDT